MGLELGQNLELEQPSAAPLPGERLALKGPRSRKINPFLAHTVCLVQADFHLHLLCSNLLVRLSPLLFWVHAAQEPTSREVQERKPTELGRAALTSKTPEAYFTFYLR